MWRNYGANPFVPTPQVADASERVVAGVRFRLEQIDRIPSSTKLVDCYDDDIAIATEHSVNVATTLNVRFVPQIMMIIVHLTW
mgnify:CR=1 FL=1